MDMYTYIGDIVKAAKDKTVSGGEKKKQKKLCYSQCHEPSRLEFDQKKYNEYIFN